MMLRRQGTYLFLLFLSASSHVTAVLRGDIKTTSPDEVWIPLLEVTSEAGTLSGNKATHGLSNDDLQETRCIDDCNKAHGTCESLAEFEKRLDALMPGEEVNVVNEVKKGTIGVYKERNVCTCQPGFKGVACSEHCHNGYGPYCWASCPNNCPDGCDTSTGKCRGGCSEGSDGTDCQAQEGDVKPRVDIKPFYRSDIVGAAVSFKCSATGIPKPKLEWSRKNGKMLNRQSTFENGKFNIPKTLSSDAGLYRCIATNRAGTDQSEARLHLSFVNETTGGLQGVFCEECTGENIAGACADNDKEISASMNMAVPAPAPDFDPYEKDPDADSAKVFLEEDQEFVDSPKNEREQLRNYNLTVLQRRRLVKELRTQLFKYRGCEILVAGVIGTSFICICLVIALIVKTFYIKRITDPKHLEEHGKRSSRQNRQADDSTATSHLQLAITSTFSSSDVNETLNVQAMFRDLLADFSDDYESTVLPGAKIVKDSIKVGQVTSVRRSSANTRTNRVNYDYLLYGGLCLTTLVLVTVLIIFVLKRRTACRRRSRLGSSVMRARMEPTNQKHADTHSVVLLKYNKGVNQEQPNQMRTNGRQTKDRIAHTSTTKFA